MIIFSCRRSSAISGDDRENGDGWHSESERRGSPDCCGGQRPL